MSDPIREAITEIETYLKRYPSGHFSELAQLHLDKLLAERGEKSVKVVSAAANPFSKGTARADLSYRIGDQFQYQVTDLLTKIPGRLKVQTVVAVTAEQVVYNRGGFITDLLGNYILGGGGSRFGPSQFYATEYSVGKKWTTRYPVVFPGGHNDEFELNFKVVGRESITVPAGTFDAFRVEGTGWILGKGVALTETYWIAPDKVARVIAIESWKKATKGHGKVIKSDREELVAFTQG